MKRSLFRLAPLAFVLLAACATSRQEPPPPASLPVAATSPKEPIDSGLPVELKGSLLPLFTARFPRSDPDGPVRNLLAGLPPPSAMALRRLNTYRIAAGLQSYRYDETLTRMAMAHVDYARASSKAGKPWSGHFEIQGQPGYSDLGNQAASTSGLSYGRSDALGALEGLMTGPFHRLQFLRPQETRVGVGFGAWEGSNNSMALFVTRPEEGKVVTPDATAPRFVLFPPAGAEGIGTTFAQERPDPRPGFDALPSRDRPRTGYPITISLRHDDARKFQSAKVKVTDGTGRPVEAWVTDPANPSIRQGPAIYADGVNNDAAFARNFGAIFVMPKSPLGRGERYNVDATLRLGDETVRLAWSFRTAEPAVWVVDAATNDPRRTLDFALANAKAGDTVHLSPGVHVLNRSIRPSNVRIQGAGVRKTTMRFGTVFEYTPVLVHGRLVLEDLTVEYPESILYVQSGATLLLRQVTLSGGDDTSSLPVILERGSSLIADRVDAKRHNPHYLCYALDQGTGAAARIWAWDVHGPSLVYGEAEIQHLTRPVTLGVKYQKYAMQTHHSDYGG